MTKQKKKSHQGKVKPLEVMRQVRRRRDPAKISGPGQPVGSRKEASRTHKENAKDFKVPQSTQSTIISSNATGPAALQGTAIGGGGA